MHLLLCVQIQTLVAAQRKFCNAFVLLTFALANWNARLTDRLWLCESFAAWHVLVTIDEDGSFRERALKEACFSYVFVPSLSLSIQVMSHFL